MGKIKCSALCALAAAGHFVRAECFCKKTRWWCTHTLTRTHAYMSGTRCKSVIREVTYLLGLFVVLWRKKREKHNLRLSSFRADPYKLCEKVVKLRYSHKSSMSRCNFGHLRALARACAFRSLSILLYFKRRSLCATNSDALNGALTAIDMFMVHSINERSARIARTHANVLHFVAYKSPQ